MSLSPLKSGPDRPPSAPQHVDAPLTVSQALIITAGLAGLVGLCSGAIVRFSLSSSDNARFLSPLQTFPTISSEASASPGSRTPNSASWENSPVPVFETEALIDASDQRQPGESATSPFTSTDNTADAAAVNPSTFDDFAARSAEARLRLDPWETLKKGPSLGAEAAANPAANEAETTEFSPSAEFISPPNTGTEPAYIEPDYTEAPYPESGYAEDSLTEDYANTGDDGFAAEGRYTEDSYPEDSQYLEGDYPPVETPAAEPSDPYDPYYEGEEPWE